MKAMFSVLIASMLFAACGGENCEPRSHTYCDPSSDQVYWLDSCGAMGAVKESCSCGCLSDLSGCEPCGCVFHDECGASSICLYGDCVAAYGRRYEFTIVRAVISTYDHNGDAWDFPGGMPDPYVCVTRNQSDVLLCTTTRQDTFRPTFDESFQADIYSSDRWDFYAFDEDVASNDTIGGVYFDPIPVNVIKNGGFYWDQGDYMEELEVSIVPVE